MYKLIWMCKNACVFVVLHVFLCILCHYTDRGYPPLLTHSLLCFVYLSITKTMDEEYSASSTSRKRRNRTAKLICQLCSRSLDDCLFVDETTKRLTPFCRSCRNVLAEKGSFIHGN